MQADADHERCAAFFRETTEPAVVPQLVLVEAAYFVRKQLGTIAEASFLRELARNPLELVALEPDDVVRMAELIERYADLRLGTVDASVVATAERFGATVIATLDRRHFAVVRPKHVDAFQLVP
jgi:predicted nucleic acid-binding protein